MTELKIGGIQYFRYEEGHTPIPDNCVFQVSLVTEPCTFNANPQSFMRSGSNTLEDKHKGYTHNIC